MKNKLSKSNYQTLLSKISTVYIQAKRESVQALNRITTRAHWDIGRHIVEVEQKYAIRAAYGARLIERLSRDLTRKFGRGFSVSNLKYMREFYREFQIGHLSGQLKWTHYKDLLSVNNETIRFKLLKKAEKEKLLCDELKQLIKKEKKRLKQKKSEVKKKLTPKRGRFFTYTVVPSPENEVKPGEMFIDVGFNRWLGIPLYGGNRRPKVGSHITAVKKKKGRYTFSSIKKKDVSFTYRAIVEKVIDADTLWLLIDCGFDSWCREKVRLRGIDAPEIDTVEGKKARAYVKRKLPKFSPVVIATYKTDKYDRYLADILYLPGEPDKNTLRDNGHFLNQDLVDVGHAILVGV